MRRAAQGMLLLAVGATLVRVAASGVAERYVRSSFVPMLWVAAVIAVGLGGFALWQEGADLVRHRAIGGEAERWAGWVLLILPVALVAVVPPALGAYTAQRYGTSLAAHAPAHLDPIAGTDPVRLSLVDYAARAVVEQGRSLSGRRVVLTGMVVTGVDGRPYLGELLADCCAADARPVIVGLTGAVPNNLVAGARIEVEGGYTDRIERDPRSGDLIPYVEVSVARVAP